MLIYSNQGFLVIIYRSHLLSEIFQTLSYFGRISIQSLFIWSSFTLKLLYCWFSVSTYIYFHQTFENPPSSCSFNQILNFCWEFTETTNFQNFQIIYYIGTSSIQFLFIWPYIYPQPVDLCSLVSTYICYWWTCQTQPSSCLLPQFWELFRIYISYLLSEIGF